MPPERTITDADIEAITKSLNVNHCQCSFSDDEVSAVRDLLNVLKETRSNIIKAFVGLLLTGLLVILAMGMKVWVKQ